MNSDYIKNLNNHYGIDNQISFISGEGGMPVAYISTEKCEAELSLYGGHMLSFTPKGFEDLLWVSRNSIYKEGTAIRGGIPVCWPWFGAHPLERTVYSHGFARRNMWQLINTKMESGVAIIKLELAGESDQMLGWPYPFEVVLEIRVGDTLEVSLSTINRGKYSYEISNALHTYFSVADVREIKVEGLDRVNYGDDVDNREIKVQSGEITISSEVDRNYRNTDETCSIVDPIKKRKINIAKKNSKTTVVWNPWSEKAAALPDFADDEYLSMICVETVNAFNDKRVVKPGETHTISTIINAESI